MLKKYVLSIVLFLGLFLAACGGKTATAPASTVETAVPVVASTSTPDLCVGENLSAEIGKLNKLTREFDDYSALASNTPQVQLIQIIPELQRVLRDAEDQTVPVCLNNLKKLQIAHMGIVVQTLMGFISSKDAQLVNAGIAQARELHSQYDIEMARLLGITLSVPPTAIPVVATPDANVAPASPVATVTITVTNLGAGSVNLRSAPDLGAPEAGLLGSQVSTIALGKTADDQWIQVQVPDKPGQFAWVYAPLVQLSVPIASVPIVTP